MLAHCQSYDLAIPYIFHGEILRRSKPHCAVFLGWSVLLRTCANLDLITLIYFYICHYTKGNARSLSDLRCRDSVNFWRGNLAEKQDSLCCIPWLKCVSKYMCKLVSHNAHLLLHIWVSKRKCSLTVLCTMSRRLEMVTGKSCGDAGLIVLYSWVELCFYAHVQTWIS